MTKLSLILPVYNVEKYLPKCIESCLSQDLPKDEYEIIVVIDGSTDGCLSIAQAYQRQYDCVKVVEQDNGGLSAARNAGLAVAKGEYVWFIDSDDFIDPNVVRGIYDAIEADQLDALWLQWREVDEDGHTIPPYSPYMQRKDYVVYTGYEFMATVLTTALFAWSFVYKRSFLQQHQLKFTEGLYYEDTDFAFRALPQVNRIRLYEKVCYNYLHRANSITNQIDEKKTKDMFFNCVTANAAMKDCPESVRHFYKACFSAMYISIVKNIIKVNDGSLKRFVIEQTQRNKFGKVCRIGNTLTNIIGMTYNWFGVRFCFFVFGLLYRFLPTKH